MLPSLQTPTTWKWMRMVLGFLLSCASLGSESASAQSSPLSSAYYHVTISSCCVSPNHYLLDEDGVFPFSVATGDVPVLGGSIFNVSAGFTGGVSPTAAISGYGFPADTGISPIGQARAEISYVVRPNALPAWAPAIANLPVPISVSGVLSGEVSPLPTVGPGGGFAEAVVDISAPGVSIREFVAVSALNTWADTNAYHRSFSVPAGTLVHVAMYARGNTANWEFSALADPRFEIDPLATFDFNGVSIRFADVVELEYSPGILVPEPTSAVIVAMGLTVLGVTSRVGRSRSRKTDAASSKIK